MTDKSREAFDLDKLLHPAHAFEHPSEVVNDPDLTLNEKRAILASWASDACAVEAASELHAAPYGPRVKFDVIMNALLALDQQGGTQDTPPPLPPRSPAARRVLAPFIRPRSGLPPSLREGHHAYGSIHYPPRNNVVMVDFRRGSDARTSVSGRRLIAHQRLS